MNPYTALLGGPRLLAPYLAVAAEERRVVDLALIALDVLVSYTLWKEPMPAWLQTVLIRVIGELRNDWPNARLIDAFDASIPPPRYLRGFHFGKVDTWIAVRLAAIGRTVVPSDHCVVEDAQAMCVALHEARLVDAVRKLFRVRVANGGRHRGRRKMIELAQEQATHYLAHLVPLAAQPSVSWEWQLLCAAGVRRQT